MQFLSFKQFRRRRSTKAVIDTTLVFQRGLGGHHFEINAARVGLNLFFPESFPPLVLFLHLLVEVRVEDLGIWLFDTIVFDPGSWFHFLFQNKLIINLVV